MYLQLAENNEICIAELSDNCGLAPLKPLHIGKTEAESRKKNPDKWAEYDRKRAAYDKCRADAGKPVVPHPINKVTLLPGRSLFLAMLDYNVDGIASRLATENISALSDQWMKLGGNPNKLVDFINKGKKKPRKQMNFLGKFKGPVFLGDGDESNPSGISDAEKAKIISATTAFGVALAAAVPATAPVALPGGPILGTVIVGVMPFVKNAANKTPSAEDAGKNIPDAPLPPDTENTGSGSGSTAPTGTAPGEWLQQTNFTGLTNEKTLIYGVNAVGGVGSGILYARGHKKAALVVVSSLVLFDVGYYLYNKYAS